MNIIQTFYDDMAAQYDQLFLDWHATTQEQAAVLNKIFSENGFDQTAQILDCACGIGTQAIGLASIGYSVTASDISDGELAEAAAVLTSIYPQDGKGTACIFPDLGVERRKLSADAVHHR